MLRSSLICFSDQLAEFQVGLAKLALRSSYLSSSEVISNNLSFRRLFLMPILFSIPFFKWKAFVECVINFILWWLLQVFGAIQQALLRVPHYPESHNLNGLICESRCDYQSAITSYRLARCALISSTVESSEAHARDVSMNLARSLCMVMLCISSWSIWLFLAIVLLKII